MTSTHNASTALSSASLDPRRQWLSAAAIVFGLLVLFVPTYATLDTHVWSREGQGHGPIMLALIAWLIWQRWPKLLALNTAPAPKAALAVFLLAAAMNLVGRTQEVMLLDTASHPLFIASLALAYRGVAAVRTLAFPLFFFIFVIPLPLSVVDALTAPLKMGVSVVAEELLAAMGYPIAREGVKLVIGQYWLMVADACAGMNSIFALEAVGVFYLSLIPHVRRARQIALALLILPISFISNVARVMVLVLITYYFGDEAGQGFLHDFAGIFLFVVATILTIGVDSILALIFPGKKAVADSGSVSVADGAPNAALLPHDLTIPRTLLVGSVCALISLGGYKLHPEFRTDVVSQSQLDDMIPRQFGGWKEVDLGIKPMQTSAADGQLWQGQPYDAQLTRTYKNEAGQLIMLAVAYGANQRQEIKIHRPEVCYPASGRQVGDLKPYSFPFTTAGGQTVEGFSMLAKDGQRQFIEPVSYWIRTGDTFSASGLKQRWHILMLGLKGERADGILVRFSQILPNNGDIEQSLLLQKQFAQELVQASSPVARQMMFDGLN